MQAVVAEEFATFQILFLRMTKERSSQNQEHVLLHSAARFFLDLLVPA